MKGEYRCPVCTVIAEASSSKREATSYKNRAKQVKKKDNLMDRKIAKCFGRTIFSHLSPFL